MSAVVVSGLVVRYGDVAAVGDLSFRAEPGLIVALLGPNGAGKTTTVETLEGYRRPDSGTVHVLGLDPVGDRAELMPRIGVMLQRGGVYPTMSPIDALHLFAAYYDRPLDPHDLLERVGLVTVARTAWRRLSGGEQQRLSLALALVGRPEVAFLDEPTAGVDPQGRLAIRSIISGLRDDGVTVILTTHDLEEAERLADHVVIIDGGKKVAEGSPAQLMASGAGKEIRFGAPSGLDRASLSAALGARVTEEQPGEYLVSTPATPVNVAALTMWLAKHDMPIGDLRAGRQRLEDVFLALTGDVSAAEVDRRPRRRRQRRSAS